MTATGVGASSLGAGPLTAGQTFGRYHIIRLLGVGGMGAVYHAWDGELGVAVAIKVIRPDISGDPESGAEIERRFKRELLLARQVTHPNVVRIHDLGEIDGIKYITMPYLQGDDLNTMLKRTGRLSVAASLRLARQIVAGLEAAHRAGVVHRDLKPANVMVEEGENAIIMDFGIARSASSGMTVAGAVVGTLEYMAPEQAKGVPVDQRADIYAFGLMWYDLLAGARNASRPESAVNDLMRRMQQPPAPIRTLNPDVPEPIERILDKCLQPDPAARYQTTRELAAELDRLDSNGHLVAARLEARAVRRAWSAVLFKYRWLAAAAAVVLLLAVAFAFRDRLRPSSGPAGPAQPVSVAVLPFRNASGDGSLDWLGPAFAEMLRTELGQSAHLRTVPSDRLHQIFRDLRLSAADPLDPPTLRRLADLSSADTMIWGQYLRFGQEIRIDATADHVKTQRAVPLKAGAPNEGALLDAVTSLAQSVRATLALAPDVVKDLQAQSRKPSTQSVQALRYYNEGMQLVRTGKPSEALKSFETAAQHDSNFALAYSRLGQAYSTRGYDAEAEQASRRAIDLSERLPPHERYLILANHAGIMNDHKKAVEYYENLLKATPDDPQVQYELAQRYEAAGSFDRARDLLGQVIARDAKYMDALLALGRVETRRQNPQGSLDYLNRALSVAIETDSDEGKARILQAIGISYKRLNKLQEALRYYRESLDIKRRRGDKGGMASSLDEIAQVQVRLGQPAEALPNFEEALRLRRDIGDKRGTGNLLLNLGAFNAELGRRDEALRLLKEALQIQREVGNEGYQALALNNIGNVYLHKGQYEDAVTYLERALQIREKANVPGEVALTLHNLAMASTQMGAYEQALAHHLRALELWRKAGERREAAMESYRLGAVFEFQGRYGAAISAREEAVKPLRALNERGVDLAEALSGYGSSLAQAGRLDEADRMLAEALQRARELKQRSLIAQALNLQGVAAFYRGDLRAARKLIEEALAAATSAADRTQTLLANVNLAKLGVAERRFQNASGALERLGRDADAAGLKYVSLDCALYLAEAKRGLGDRAGARQTLERIVPRAERLGASLLLASTHQRLAALLREAGSATEASRHAATAERLMSEIRRNTPAERILARADLKEFAPAESTVR